MLINMTETRLTLSRERTVTHFMLSDVTGVYTSVGGDTISKTNEGMAI